MSLLFVLILTIGLCVAWCICDFRCFLGLLVCFVVGFRVAFVGVGIFVFCLLIYVVCLR